jgi:hypothetical protein
VLLTVGLTQHWQNELIVGNALNAGAIHWPPETHRWLANPCRSAQIDRAGAATSVLLAASPLVDGIGGRYLEVCNESPIVTQRPNDFSGGVAPYALDRHACGRGRGLEAGAVLDALSNCVFPGAQC